MSNLKMNLDLNKIRYDEKGLVPAIAQDYLDGTVLMMAWMNVESLQKTLETGQAHYWSRSRQQLWHKGATSGHFQQVQELRYDCDSDTLLLKIEQIGNIACHTGMRSCFDSNDKAQSADVLTELFEVICSRRDDPSPESYTCKLLAGGNNKILKKIGEESAEVVMACMEDEPQAIASEVADLFYHALVALAHHNVNLRDVYVELHRRRA